MKKILVKSVFNKSKKKITYVLFYNISIILLFINCSKKEIINTKIICDNFQNTSYDTNILCAPKIMAYQYGLENLDAEQKVNELYNLGMDGIILEIENNNYSTLIDYYLTDKVLNKQFQIYDVFTTVDINNPNDIEIVDNIYSIIKCTGTRLQVIFKGNKNNPILITTISKISDIAKSYHKNLIIYPHYGTAIETAEEAFSYITIASKENIFLSLHLCHELASGNGNRISEVIENVSPLIKSVSISGANLSEKDDNSLPLWFWGIKPLNMGNYEYDDFINSLYINQYKGPIAIHTWGIYDNFGLKPNQYLPHSKNILIGISNTICN